MNQAIRAAVEYGSIHELKNYEHIHSEPRVSFKGYPPSRFDLLLESTKQKPCYVEIKNTTLLTGDREQDNPVSFWGMTKK